MDKKDIEDLSVWYHSHKHQVDRIINDSKKDSYESMMHVYGYAAKLLRLENVVSQEDFPEIFSNYYHHPLVGDSLSVMFFKMAHSLNLRTMFKFNILRRTAMYWLACGDLYEVLVDKIIGKLNETDNPLNKKYFHKLAEQLIDSSLKNGLKTQSDWDFLKDDNEGARIYHVVFSPLLEEQEIVSKSSDVSGKTDSGQTQGSVKEAAPQIPPELDTERGRAILKAAIDSGLCNERFEWQKSATLLAYFASRTSDFLKLSNSELGKGDMATNWQPFIALFGDRDYRSLKNNWRKTGILPKGYEIVDGIFD
ncbi:MAG: DUF6043 family protein [Prevotella sp.]|jgi:hypothetical protein